MANGNGMVQTIIGGATAVFIAVGGLYTVAIVPIKEELREIKTLREDDRKQLIALYLSIQTNDEYKKFAQGEHNSLRRDLEKTDAHVLRIDLEQQRRTSSVATVSSNEKRIDGLTRRLEEMQRSSSPTIIDEVKELRGEISSLRQRIMVPITSH